MRAANVVNATGVWADQLRPQELHDEAELPRIRPSRGTHITLRHEDLPLRRRGDRAGRRRAHDLRAAVARAHADRAPPTTTTRATLEHVAPVGRGRRVPARRGQRRSSAPSSGRAQLTGAFAGVRPLISTGDPKKSVDISRKAELYETSSGMITITGGKLTTWRRMAKMTVDRHRRARRPRRALPHARDPARPGDRRRASCRAWRASPEASYAALAGPLRPRRPRRARARRRARRARAADRRRACPTCSPRSVLAARREQARSIGDVLLRRTRLGLLAARELEPSADGERQRARASARCSRASSAGTERARARARALRRRPPRGIRPRPSRRSAALAVMPALVSVPLRRLRAGELTLELGARPWLMGIVNASPDSFSDGGRHADARRAGRSSPESCSRRAPTSSTSAASPPRPAARRSRSSEEIERVVPLVERVAGELGAIVSVDTYKPAVARAAIAAGARSSTTSAACATRAWPRSAPRRARRSW